jgi:hypothetical protein
MNLSTRLIPLALLSTLAAGTAAAQPGQPPPPPPGYGPAGPAPYYGPPPIRERRGLTLGVGFGLGGMSAESGPIRCDGCGGNPLAAGIDFHIGGMIRPNLAILFELSGTGVQLDAEGTEVLTQVMLMGAVQYWITPQLWIKGGLGSAHLSINYDDGYEADQAELDSGVGGLAAVGYEVLHAPNFALDLSLRLQAGGYEGLDDEIHSGLLAFGASWY